MRQDPFLYVAASVGLTLGAALAAAPAQAQVQAALNVGGKKMEFRGQGQCKAAAQASIYDIPAALYSVSQSSGSQSMNMTLWQPKSGAASMISLHISDGAKRSKVTLETYIDLGGALPGWLVSGMMASNVIGNYEEVAQEAVGK